MPCRPFSVVRLLVPLAGAAAALAGCADAARIAGIAPAGVDPRSPLAAQAQAATERDYPYPSFRDVPARPVNVRPPEQWKAAVVESVGDRRALRAWWAQNPPMVTDTEAYATNTRAQIPADVLKPLPGMAAESTEAYAERLRKLGAAPAPLPRGPAPQPVPRQ